MKFSPKRSRDQQPKAWLGPEQPRIIETRVGLFLHRSVSVRSFFSPKTKCSFFSSRKCRSRRQPATIRSFPAKPNRSWKVKKKVFVSESLVLKITCFQDDEFSKKNLLESRSEKKVDESHWHSFFLVLERNATYTRTGRMFFKNGQFFNRSWSRRVVESHWGLLVSASAPFKYLLTNDKYGFSSIASFLETQQRLTLLNSPAEPSDF